MVAPGDGVLPEPFAVIRLLLNDSTIPLVSG